MIIRQTAVAGTLESSDVMVTIRPAEKPGLTIDIQSIVLTTFGDQIRATTEEVLAELGATEQKRIEVINKCDEGDPDPVFPGAVMISAKTGEGLEELKAKIAEVLQESHRPVTFMIPFSRYGILSEIRPLGRVITENHTDTGTELTLMIAGEDVERLVKKYGTDIVID